MHCGKLPGPRWTPINFGSGDLRKHVRKYGPVPVGKFLASFTGHAVCVDYFGGPSEAEAAQGLALHGEAANSRWKLLGLTQSSAEARLLLAARLPAAGLRFRRELRLRHNESVVYVEERVANERAQDHFFHWTEHVTLGLPLLHPDESIIALPGTRAITWPHGYEGASLVRDNQEFTWPEAPAIEGGMVNLARPFARDGKGFVVGVLLDPTAQARICGGIELATWAPARLLFPPLRLSLGCHLGGKRCSHGLALEWKDARPRSGV